jgi:class 3 adenylate cyclase
MGWNFEVSKKRIASHIQGMAEIAVDKLVRDADLESLLSEGVCREIFGSHVYVDVDNFANLAAQADGGEYRRVIQAVHLYQREVARIVERAEMFNGVRVHFQGSRLHALFYRPIDSAEELASRAVLLQIALRQFAQNIFSECFPALPSLNVVAGADIGNAIGTQDGMKGDRELLFLGAPANYAAKIIGTAAPLCVTADIYDSLPENLQDVCYTTETSGVCAIEELNDAEVADLMRDFDIDLDLEASRTRVETDKRQFPLKNIEYSDAEELINLDSLGVTNNKRVLAASIFADVSGFTAYIDATSTEHQKKGALRVLHAIRKEMSAVVKHDFDGLRIQYQGDRVQALFHLPKDDGAALTKKAIEVAAGLQSSMEFNLKTALPEASSLGLAIGIDVDVTLVSQLGTRGQRDRICIGTAVENAARSQEVCNGGEIGLTPRAFDALDLKSRSQFSLDKTRNVYVATNLTTDHRERHAKAAAYQSGRVYVKSSGTGISISGGGLSGGREVLPSKSFAD